jgi:hypothetical protein
VGEDGWNGLNDLSGLNAVRTRRLISQMQRVRFPPTVKNAGGLMDLQIKVFRWPNQANHIIMLAHGTIDADGFRQIFRKVTEMSAPLLDCKILVDLLSAKCTIEAADIEKFFSEVEWEYLSHNNKLALVFARANKQYDHVSALSASLLKQGVKIAVFDDSDVAAEWLVNVA